MNAAQRVVAVLYCLLVVYCCVWVPWVANFRGFNDIHQGYGWVWSPPSKEGVPSLAAIATRLLAVTALSGAAFLLAGKWKVLLLVGLLAGGGILLYRYRVDKSAEHQAQNIHDCAVAKVATAKCTPSVPSGYTPKQGEIDLSAGFVVCDSYVLHDNPTAQEEDTAITAAEKECTAEIAPKQKSAHEQIEEYKRQHGIKQ
jgi:hypothetical protein